MRPAAELVFPMGPLLEATGLSETELRHRVATCNSLMWRKARDEGLSLAQADRWALKAGTMPEWVWPDLFLAVPDNNNDDEEVAA